MLNHICLYIVVYTVSGFKIKIKKLTAWMDIKRSGQGRKIDVIYMYVHVTLILFVEE